MRKCWGMVFMVLALSILGSMSAFAGKWEPDGANWQYVNDNGEYARSEWIRHNEKWYYIGENSYMLSDAWEGNYYLGADGAMLVDTITPDGYKVGADGAWIPEASDTGYLEKYAEVLRELMRTNPSGSSLHFNPNKFQLIYVDEDSTPELLVSTGFTKTYPLLYTYYQGSAKLLGEFHCDSWECFYAERENLFHAGLWYNGNRTDDIFYMIKDGELSLVTRFYADHFMERDYSINQQPVSRTNYENQLNAMKNSRLFKKVDQNTTHDINEENIQKC